MKFAVKFTCSCGLVEGLAATDFEEVNGVRHASTGCTDFFPPPPKPVFFAEPQPYSQLASAIGQLVTEKQEAYGDSFGKSGRIMRELYPNGVSPAQMDDALTVVRVIDKLFRIATKKDAFGESPWRDVMGYALLSVKRDEDAKTKPAP